MTVCSKRFFSLLVVTSGSMCCFAATLTVQVLGTPVSANLVEVIIDGKTIAKPIMGAAVPDSHRLATIKLTTPDGAPLRLRAIAVTGTGAFPQILALAAQNVTSSGGVVAIDFTMNPLQVKMGLMSDGNDGTITLPVTLLGGNDFFTSGEIVNLWISLVPPRHDTSGSLIFAPIARSSASTWIADFKVSKHLVGSTPYLQFGYQALAFNFQEQTPLLLFPSFGQMNPSPLPASDPDISSSQARPAGSYATVKDKNGRLKLVPLPSR